MPGLQAYDQKDLYGNVGVYKCVRHGLCEKNI
jgi:hypothetical protein